MAGVLQLTGINKIFDTGKQHVTALENVDIDIGGGDLFCILGPSGCGKSTLLRCIAGFEHPDSGEILVDGKAVDRPGPDRVMVFQGFDQLLPWKTVLENVEYPLKVNKTAAKKERRDISMEFVSLVGLADFAHNYPHQLSGGMKQRVAIARALAMNPKVLLMDEPFASLDAQTRTALQNELISIWERFRTTIVFITHNIQEAIILGSRIAVMSKQPGTIKEIIENNLDRPRFVGYPGFDEKWKVLHALLDFNRLS
ncbi:MAG: nitrate ABC transporter substrate-binding protein [Firmicutes bacterium HGW-Firmicutes-14]|nr:MAG: nitrate ABC transporter substrate-binding protein [Firmicutes bacterium HGW-Firmicutes-14]